MPDDDGSQTPQDRRSSRFDRIGAPDPQRARDRDEAGKEALYSTSPRAEPTSPVLVICERCDVERGLSLAESVRLLLPPVLVRPFAKRIWTRCPTCERYAWLRVRQGQALRAYLGQSPWRT